MKSLTVARTAIVISSISIILVIAGVFISSGSRAESSEQWQPLSELVSPQRLTQIIADNTAPSANRAEIASSAVGLQEGDLLIVDFDTATLCGIGGCAIAGYRVSTGEQILFTYARQLDTNQPIVKLVESPTSELPCLLIAPPINTTASGLTRDTLCYRDGEWTVEEL